ncbi:hypothetical protein Fraau_0154 [Frateuria aurantia DSM 6220]|uniref:Uncharacterized protein n=1 Tax=Frateuria aurantia (strain ATCC 33424 / DSM 6220 / KCTC 2777 / LMG 1558 / NBRC 3245 / NCIMB 13370) TaxID=767434 RepID=H8L0M6_FRAAD|nr:hypothetical protein Fraau_0154 [Frateuria aurantia DSM 6220]
MMDRLISIVAAGQIRASPRSTRFRKWSPGGLPVAWSA